ncbi:viral A-type inclusion protein [Reticulomyxa filosa]|uniref:Viral A-type inclusion protein n=1 Tax=Reticulomyxa filosa TaxID=46433 RepID=X6MJQ3_RETFI|nr:viral A-type inclusion protein [Reticulomyxa filosa]|eukprot:ETO13682.1 viral A-type inclusion protein [Reticulomyxa filosa]
MAAKYESLEGSLQKDIESHISKRSKLQNENDLLRRKNQVSENDIKQLQKLNQEVCHKLNDEVNSLKVSLTHTNGENLRLKEQTLVFATTDRSERFLKELKNLRQTCQKDRKTFDEQLEELRRSLEDKELSLIQWKEQLRHKEETLEKLTTQNETLDKRLRELEIQTKQQLCDQKQRFQSEIEHYKTQLNELQTLHEQSEVKASDLLKAQNAMSQRWRNENRSTILQFQKSLQELKQENVSLHNQNLKLTQQVSQMLQEKNQALSENKMCKQVRLQVVYQKYRSGSVAGKAEEQKKEVEKAHQEMEIIKKSEGMLVEQNKKLRRDLDKIETDAKRWQRQATFATKKAEVAMFQQLTQTNGTNGFAIDKGLLQVS